MYSYKKIAYPRYRVFIFEILLKRWQLTLDTGGIEFGVHSSKYLLLFHTICCSEV